MDRAEPVEIEHIQGNSGQEIQMAARISRDALAPVRQIYEVSGLVLELVLQAENGATAAGENHDFASITVLPTDLDLVKLTLDLQSPERLVVNEQLEIIRESQIASQPLRFLVDSGRLDGVEEIQTEGEEDPIRERRLSDKRDDGYIIAVSPNTRSNIFGEDKTIELSGFVESLSLIEIPFLRNNALLSNFAHVQFTSAPSFVGVGNMVGLDPFTPTTMDLIVPKNSLTYSLFEAGLRDNLRMRTKVILPQEPDTPQEPNTHQEPETPASEEIAAGLLFWCLVQKRQHARLLYPTILQTLLERAGWSGQVTTILELPFRLSCLHRYPQPVVPYGLRFLASR